MFHPRKLGKDLKMFQFDRYHIFSRMAWVEVQPPQLGYDDDEKVLERRKKAKEAKALEPVLQAIHGHPEVSAVQLQAAMALHQLLYTEEGGKKFEEMVMFKSVFFV